MNNDFEVYTFAEWITDYNPDSPLTDEILRQSKRAGFKKINSIDHLLKWMGNPSSRIFKEQVDDLWEEWQEWQDYERAKS